MAAENVVKFYPRNAAEKPDYVLEQAIGMYEDVLVIGYDKGGDLDVRSSSYFADGGNLMWILEKFKFNLLAGVYSGEDGE